MKSPRKLAARLQAVAAQREIKAGHAVGESAHRVERLAEVRMSMSRTTGIASAFELKLGADFARRIDGLAVALERERVAKVARADEAKADARRATLVVERIQAIDAVHDRKRALRRTVRGGRIEPS